jgi:hypothetical protein
LQECATGTKSGVFFSGHSFTSNKLLAYRELAVDKLSRSALSELPISIHFLAREYLHGRGPVFGCSA